MKRQFVVTLIILMMDFVCLVNVSAQEQVLINGLLYTFSTGKATVVAVEKEAQLGDLQIPASVNYEGKEYNVIYIGDDAFRNCIGLTSLKLPEGLIGVGKWAFFGCSNLVIIEFPVVLVDLV